MFQWGLPRSPRILSLTAFPTQLAKATVQRSPFRQQPIRVPKTAEIVADHIRKRIVGGELREGDFLPLESQVVAEFGISRPTLREALRILEAESLITVMRGSRSGARVQLPTVEWASRYAGFVLQAQGTKIADIYEARLAIEPYVVRRLAERRPDGAVARLRAETDRLEAMIDAKRYRDFMIGLAEFHRLLVELSGVRTLLFLTRMLQEILARHQVLHMERSEIPEGVHRKNALVGMSSFRKLIAWIEAGEPAKAESHWRLHLLNANATWVPQSEHKTVVDVFE